MEKNNTTVAGKSKPAKGFVNWELRHPTTGEVMLKSGRGFTIQDSEKYPNKAEDALIELCKKHGDAGELELTLHSTIKINTIKEVNLDELGSLFGSAV